MLQQAAKTGKTDRIPNPVAGPDQQIRTAIADKWYATENFL